MNLYFHASVRRPKSIFKFGKGTVGPGQISSFPFRGLYEVWHGPRAASISSLDKSSDGFRCSPLIRSGSNPTPSYYPYPKTSSKFPIPVPRIPADKFLSYGPKKYQFPDPLGSPDFFTLALDSKIHRLKSFQNMSQTKRVSYSFAVPIFGPSSSPLALFRAFLHLEVCPKNDKIGKIAEKLSPVGKLCERCHERNLKLLCHIESCPPPPIFQNQTNSESSMRIM